MEHTIKIDESDHALIEKYREKWQLSSKQKTMVIIMAFVRHNEFALSEYYHRLPEE